MIAYYVFEESRIGDFLICTELRATVQLIEVRWFPVFQLSIKAYRKTEIFQGHFAIKIGHEVREVVAKTNF